MTANAIETKNLSYSFDHRTQVVKNLSLQVPKGSIYGFLGPNGAGKTTTIRLLTGMLKSNADNIFINGQSLLLHTPQIFEKVGALIETPSLYLHLSGYENLKIITTLRGLPLKKIDSVLYTVGLEKAGKKKAKEYSLGMKQRLGIAMSLLADPELLILDEPVNGLDPQGIVEIRELLKLLNKETGVTIFVSSHLLAEVERMCTHIGIINRGVLRYQGLLQNMKQDATASGEVLFRVDGNDDLLQKLQPVFNNVRQPSQNELIFPFTSPQEVAIINQQLVNMDIPVTGIQVRGGLEEWFMQIIEKDKTIA